jgi:DNA-binding CsgD family transcriptional regulator
MLVRADPDIFRDEAPARREHDPERRREPVEALASERSLAIFDAFQVLGCACAAIDAAGRVVQINDEGRAYLGGALELAQGRLVAADRGGNEALQGLLARALEAFSPSSGVKCSGCVTLTRPEGRPLILFVYRFRDADREGCERGGAMVVVVDPDEPREPAESLVRQVFGLTSAEARLAIALVRGLDVKEIAALNGVAEVTIRSQLKSVLAKTETHRQSELVALVARLLHLPRMAGEL